MIVALDAGPLARIANPRANSTNLLCLRWARALIEAGHRLVVPEVVDLEVRRLLLRSGSAEALVRLDRVAAALGIAVTTRPSTLRAAELWAEVRRGEWTTWGPEPIDGDAILASQALAMAGSADSVVVATDNAGGLGRFVEARHWTEIQG